jgi:hypothetical protein
LSLIPMEQEKATLMQKELILLKNLSFDIHAFKYLNLKAKKREQKLPFNLYKKN